MSALALGVLAATLLERNDLGAAGLLDHFARHRGAGDDRRADLPVHHQDLVERDRFAGFGDELLGGDDVVGGNLVLLAAGLDDCEHRFCPRVRSGSARLRRTAVFLCSDPAWIFGRRALLRESSPLARAARNRAQAREPRAKRSGYTRASVVSTRARASRPSGGSASAGST